MKSMHILTITSLLPIAIAISFLLHWITLFPIRTSSERLVLCRGAYIAFSFQLVLYSIALYWVGNRAHPFIIFAMLSSFMGDFFNLQFPDVKKKLGEPLAYGIGSFAIAQIFYLLALMEVTRWDKIFSLPYSYLILIVLLIVPAIIFKFRVYNPSRPKIIMVSAFLYGILLCFLVALYLNSALTFGGYWWLLVIGGGFFLLSDAVMGETTIHGGRHPRSEFQLPWFTYLIAQGFLILGFFAVSH
jgi:hypothetical protein